MSVSKFFIAYFLVFSFSGFLQASSISKEDLKKELSDISHITTVEEMIEAYSHKEIDDPGLRKLYPSRLFENLSHQLMDEERALSEEDLQNIYKTGMLGFHIIFQLCGTFPCDFNFFLRELNKKTSSEKSRNPFYSLRADTNQKQILGTFLDNPFQTSFAKRDKFLKLFFDSDTVSNINFSLINFKKKISKKYALVENFTLFEKHFKKQSGIFLYTLDFGSELAAYNALVEAGEQLVNLENGSPVKLDFKNTLMVRLFAEKSAETGFVDGINFLIGYYYKLGDKYVEEKEKWIKKLFERNNFQFTQQYLNLLENQGRHEELDKWIVKFSNSVPSSQSEGLGDIFKGSGRRTAAEICYEKGSNNGSISSMIKLGDILEEQNHYCKAEKYYREAIRKGNETQKEKTKIKLGNVLIKQKNFSEAESYLIDDLKIDLAKERIIMGKTDLALKYIAHIYGAQNKVQDLYSLIKTIDKSNNPHFKEFPKESLLFHFAEFPVGWNKNEELRNCSDNITQNMGGNFFLKYIENISSEEPEEKERLYKKAISNGVENAEVLYADFLRERNLVTMAEEFEDLIGEDEPDDMSSSDEELEESNLPSAYKDISNSKKAASSSSSSESTKIFKKEKKEKEEAPEKQSKKKTKEEKRIRRVQKVRASLPELTSMKPTQDKDLTYRDLIVTAHKEAHGEFNDEVQRLLG